jgi:rhodanese-related sulfurtransferase
MSSVDAAHAGVPDISRQDLIRAMRDGRVTVVDVLSPESFAAMHIPGAVNLPVADLARRAKEVLPNPRSAIVAYCGGPT